MANLIRLDAEAWLEAENELFEVDRTLSCLMSLCMLETKEGAETPYPNLTPEELGGMFRLLRARVREAKRVFESARTPNLTRVSIT